MALDSSSSENERHFYSSLIADYLKYGSVDAVFRVHKYNLPISYPGFQRLIGRWGIVKAAGPNSKLSEAITFFILLSDKKIPLERLYKYLPPSFKTSMGTLHRILHNIKEGVIRRAGTALVIDTARFPRAILVGEDVSTPRLELGKPFGSISLPICYSKVGEDVKTSILRVLQQEVFTLNAIDKKMPVGIIPDSPHPLMFLDVADVRVAVYHLTLPDNLAKSKSFSSFKINNHRFMSLESILGGGALTSNLRVGVVEVASVYKDYLDNMRHGRVWQPKVVKCELNRKMGVTYALSRY